ncbi:MAG: RNA polymerase factor sigma-54 [Chitinophagales bacterium]|nr:RNA polymerase factor sigma-54 [Chitinophagales bacterium]
MQAIEDDLAFSQNIYCSKEEVEKVLSFIQQLDPPGVGARNLQECLLIQLRRKPYKTHSTILALQIIEEHFDLFIKKHFDKLEKILGVSQEKFKDVLHEITHLNPKPSSAAETTDNNEHYIVPDFAVHNNNGELVVSLNRRNAPELRINQAFREMLQRLKKSKKLSRKDREAIHFIKQKIESAKWFIDAIQQRQNTMLAVMNAIVMLQHDFFLTGDVSSLKPMILKDIEKVTKLDVSTLSRITHNKFVETEFGTFPLRFFFSDALTTREGEEVSTHEVKNALKGIIEKENKASPYTDQDLTEILNEMGYKLTRRTVAKYREAMHIPVARLRKQTV